MKPASSIYIPLLGFLLLFFSAGCENDPAEIENMLKETKEVEEAKNVNAIFSQSGNLKAVLKAPVMYRVKADTVYTEFPNSIHVTFYNETGAIDNIVQARYAKYFEFLKKVYMRDNVVVYNMTGDTLYAQDMWWDQNQEIFYSNNPVRIRTVSQKLRGSGITAKSDFSKYTIQNPVGDVAIPEEVRPN